jgi:flagellar biosynthesis protein FliQ
MLAGIWLFVSPWVYGAYTNPNAWNSWIVGAVIAILAAMRLSNSPTQTWMSYLNCLLGIWTFASPWIYGYTGNTGRFVNSLCVGVVVFVLAITSANATSHRLHDMPTRS